MADSTPHFAPIVVLLFLGAVFATAVSILVLLIGLMRRSKLFVRVGGGASLAVVAGYLLLLCGASLASNERVLPAGGWKYFCELDCHIGYSVSSVQTTAVIGQEKQQLAAEGQFVVVRLNVWFDERTISPRRGNGLLTPNGRRVVLVDGSGRTYAESPFAEAEVTRLSGDAGSLRRPLRPGQSFAKDLVFDVPKDASGLRLLITEDDPETLLIIGHENSLLHSKIYLGLEPVPPVKLAR